jgi:hypothetical protein
MLQIGNGMPILETFRTFAIARSASLRLKCSLEDSRIGIINSINAGLSPPKSCVALDDCFVCRRPFVHFALLVAHPIGGDLSASSKCCRVAIVFSFSGNTAAYLHTREIHIAKTTGVILC